jgi:hypothetical protein
MDDGATGEIGLDLAEDEGAPARRGRLVLAVSDPDPELAPELVIDGQPRGAYRAPVALPPGLHAVRVLRAGFLPVERTVMVPEGGEAVARVTLAPTPETRAAYKHRTGLVRRWSWTAVIGGAALTAGAATLVALNRAPLGDAEAEIARLRPMFEPTQYCSMSGTSTGNHYDDPECKGALDAADENANLHRNLQTMGLIGMGVGVVAAGVGAVLLLTGDDPDRYDRTAPERERLTASGWVGRGGGGLGLAGTF